MSRSRATTKPLVLVVLAAWLPVSACLQLSTDGYVFRCDAGACWADGGSVPRDGGYAGAGGAPDDAGSSGAGAGGGTACTAAACDGGCCAAAGCAPAAYPTCAGADGRCEACDALRTDRCTPAGCACGSSAACAAGQRCVDAGCACDLVSCALGCCAAGQCSSPSLDTCGSGGGVCRACDARVADRCDALGECRCGTGPSCSAGQSCDGGACGARAWRRVPTDGGPSARSGAALAYDEDRRVTVLFGGEGPGGALLGDTWEWDGQSWRELGGVAGPGPRTEAALAYSPLHAGVILVGGRGGNGAPPVTLWTFDGGGWVESLVDAGQPADLPTPRRAPALAGHPTGRPLLYGGTQLVAFAEPWRIARTQWVRAPTITTTIAAPLAVFDERRSLFVIVGGDGSQLLEFDGSLWDLRTPANTPGPHFSAAAAYDATAAQTVLFGGTSTRGGAELAAGVWTWDGMRWRSDPASPPLRRAHGMAFDRARQRLVVFGGASADGGLLDDTWER